MGGATELRGRVADVAVGASVVQEGGPGLVLTGQPGIGKSRVAREIAQRVSGRYVTVAWVQATATAQEIPFGAVAPYLPPSDQYGDLLPVLVTAGRALRELAGDGRLLLVVDDAPLLDPASALLVAQAVTAGDATLLATQRDGAALPEPLRRLGLQRRELAPLDDASAAALVDELAGAPVDHTTRARLCRLADGNPLYLHELVLAGQEADAWSDGAGGRHLRDDIGATARLAELVDARFDGLAAEAADGANLLALGEPLGVVTLESMTSPAAVEQLDELGLVNVVLDGRRTQLHLAHPLYTEVLRARMSVLRRRRLYRRLGDQLAAEGARRRDDLMRMATWYLDSGEEPPFEVLVPAAKHARRAGDDALAERFLRASMAAKPTFEAGYLLADTVYRKGRSADAVAALDVIDALASSASERLTSTLTRAADAYWNLGDAARTDELFDEASEIASDDAGRIAVAAMRASFLATSRRFDEAVLVAEPCLDAPPGRPLLDAALAMAFAARGMGRGDAAVDVVDRAAAVHAAFGDDVAMMTTQVIGTARTLTLIDLGRLDDAEQAAAETLAAARTTGEVAALAFVELNLGWLMFHRGRFATSAEHYDAAERLLRTMRRPGMVRWACIGAMMATVEGGDPEGARRRRRTLEALGAHPAALFDGGLARADAALLRAEGRPEDARQALLVSADTAQASADLVTAASCLHDVVRFGAPQLVVERLGELAGRVDGAWVPLYAAHADAAAAGDADGLAAAAGEFERLGALALAAEVAREVSDAYARRGDQRTASRWTNEARRLSGVVEHTGMVTAAGLGGPDPLTRREREVAELAADGLASKVIGERLYVSTRTVESHLLRIYAKLGVRTRAELTDLLSSPDR